MEIKDANRLISNIIKNIGRVIKGKEETITKMLAALISGGHVLLEDVPGTGKTTLAKALSRSIGTEFKRVQFTSDLLPSDILGVSIYSQKENRFVFNKGPIFTNILLADEINRANPRTQSALLEAMGEKQITIEGKQYELEKLFFVVSTENPIESHGTYPLPESQLDRFMIKLSPGYVDKETEFSIISDHMNNNPLNHLNTVIQQNELLEIMRTVNTVRISDELKHYIVEIASATRASEFLTLGASTRATIALAKMSQAIAFIRNREFIVPEDIIEVSEDVLSHRVQLHHHAKFSGITNRSVIRDIIQKIPSPE